MGEQRTWLETWITKRARKDELTVAPILYAAADAFDAASESGTLSTVQLARVVEAASHSQAIVWSAGSNLLGQLAARWPLAGEALLNMSRDRRAGVRFSALCAVSAETPLDLADAMLRAGLLDRSSKVRWKAADRAVTCVKSHLVPEVAAALAAETNPRARRSLEHDLAMLRDGYILTPEGPNTFFLQVRYDRGQVGNTVTQRQIDAKGLPALVEGIRAAHAQPSKPATK